MRDHLRSLGFMDADNGISVEEQKSEVVKIKRLLSKASKQMTGKPGYPEFIVSSLRDGAFAILIECKPSTSKHESKKGNDPVNYAVDGAIHYAKFLAEKFTVVAVAVSGTTESSLKISNYLIAAGTTEAKPLVNEAGTAVSSLVSFDDYYRLASFDPDVTAKRHADLLEFSKDLHELIWTKAKISEEEKPLLVSGTLIALMNVTFQKTFQALPADEIQDAWLTAIRKELEKADIPDAKKETMIQPYSSIAVHPNLGIPDSRTEKEYPAGIFNEIIDQIFEHVWPYLNVYHDFDVVGQFYGEFLKYTAGDKKALGIVLTPRHVAELFSKLANVGPKSTVLDICAGTGGFLISAMSHMLARATTDEERCRIKRAGLIGIENNPKMFALAASNMILRGDGKANLHQASCFDEAVVKSIKEMKPNVGLLNPPYSQSKSDAELHELYFVKQMLDCLAPGSIGITIVPISCAIASHVVREELLKHHTLDAVMSMPPELFHPVGVVTCIMIWISNEPHEASDRKTWFGFWRHDGFTKTKHKGRIDLSDAWPTIRDHWVEMYRNREVRPGESVLEYVDASQEWVAEAHMKTNYGKLKHEEFEADLKKYAVFQIMNETNGLSAKPSQFSMETDDWLPFKLCELFEIKKGKRLTKADMTSGDVPFVGASETDNGLTARISEKPIHEGGTITVSYNGSVGEAFFQPFPFWASDDVNVLYPIGFKLNALRALFVCRLIRLEKYRFNYGRKWHLERMRDTTIYLPAKDNETPDWEVIESYMAGFRHSSFVVAKTETA